MIDAPDIEELTQAPIQAPLDQDPDPGEFLWSHLSTTITLNSFKLICFGL